jgi:hypothetical protein
VSTDRAEPATARLGQIYLLVLSLPVIRLLIDLFEKKILRTMALPFRAFLVTASCPAFWVFATFPGHHQYLLL